MAHLHAKVSHEIQGFCIKSISTQSDQTGYNYCLILCLGFREAWLGSGLLKTWPEACLFLRCVSVSGKPPRVGRHKSEALGGSLVGLKGCAKSEELAVGRIHWAGRLFEDPWSGLKDVRRCLGPTCEVTSL